MRDHSIVMNGRTLKFGVRLKAGGGQIAKALGGPRGLG